MSYENVQSVVGKNLSGQNSGIKNVDQSNIQPNINNEINNAPVQIFPEIIENINEENHQNFEIQDQNNNDDCEIEYLGDDHINGYEGQEQNIFQYRQEQFHESFIDNNEKEDSDEDTIDNEMQLSDDEVGETDSESFDDYMDDIENIDPDNEDNEFEELDVEFSYHSDTSTSDDD
uniref:Uncharacterized protein n=1 Tax=Parastrongyloides trichosuri TaxID=131310 RepID=A0A0N5A3I0_PARTI